MNNLNEYREPKTLDLDYVMEIIQKHYCDFLDNGGIIGVNFTFQTDPKGRSAFDLETVHLYTNHPGIVIGTKGETVRALEEKIQATSFGCIKVHVHNIVPVIRLSSTSEQDIFHEVTAERKDI